MHKPSRYTTATRTYPLLCPREESPEVPATVAPEAVAPEAVVLALPAPLLSGSCSRSFTLRFIILVLPISSCLFVSLLLLVVVLAGRCFAGCFGCCGCFSCGHAVSRNPLLSRFRRFCYSFFPPSWAFCAMRARSEVAVLISSSENPLKNIASMSLSVSSMVFMICSV